MIKRHRIWIPEAPAIIKRNTELYLPTNIVIAGFIGWELVHARTGDVVRSSPLQKNLITNAGLDAWNTESLVNLQNWCRVGTGSATPAFTDTALESQIAATTSSGGFSTIAGLISGNEYFFNRVIRVFTASQANGNLTEVGFSSSSATPPLLNRQLFLDDLGVPTTIVKTSDFELRIIFEARIYLPLTDAIISVTVNGVARDVRRRIGSFATWNTAGNAILTGVPGSVSLFESGNTFGAAGSNPSGTSVGWSTLTPEIYVNGNYYLDVTLIWNPSIANNVLGYSFLTTTQEKAMKFDLTESAGSPIIKTDTQRFVAVIRSSWGRYAP